MTMEQARGRTGAGNGGKTGRKTVRGKDPETVAQEQFEAWMQRIMERFDRQDRIISVLINKDAAGVKINKDAAGVKYMDGERLYDNQDLCEMLRTSKRSLQRFRSEYGLRYRKISRKSYYKDQPQELLQGVGRAGVHQPEHGGGSAGRREGAEDEGRGKEDTGQGEEKRREACGGTPLRVYRKGEKKEKGMHGQSPGSPGIPPRPMFADMGKGKAIRQENG